MTLTKEQQIERFGMTIKQAHILRDRVMARLSPKELSAARRAWQDLAYELRGGRGAPMRTDKHPEAIRFCMVKALDEGLDIEGAKQAALNYAGVAS